MGDYIIGNYSDYVVDEFIDDLKDINDFSYEEEFKNDSKSDS